MKKVLGILVVVTALIAVLALSVCAEIQTGDVYRSKDSGSGAKKAEIQYYTGGVLGEKGVFDPETCDKTGLCYTYDTKTKTITIDYAEGYNRDTITNEWILPDPTGAEKSNPNVKYIIIKADITSLPEKALNSVSNAQEITIPASLDTLGGQSMARLYNLKAVKVAGVDEEYYAKFSDYDRIIDLRNIGKVSANSLQDLCSTAKTSSTDPRTLTNVAVLLGDKSAGGKTVYACEAKYFGPHSKVVKTDSVTVPDDNCLKFTFFVPDSIEKPEETKFFTNINEYVSSGVSYCNYYEHEIKRYPKAPTYNYALSLDGFQIRTEKYNGLRGVFSFDSTAANDGYTLKEVGTVAVALVGNKTADSVAYEVKYDEGEGRYLADTTDFAYTTLIWQSGDSTDNLDEFYVTVIDYELAKQMSTPILMTGYEVWKSNTDDSELILYTCEEEDAVAPQSLYDVTLGMYTQGLINHKDEQKIAEGHNHAGEFIYWSVLELCKTQLSIADGQTGVNAGDYKYTVQDGDFVDKYGVKVSAFVKGGTVYLIAHTHSATENAASDLKFVGGGDKTPGKVNYLNYIKSSYKGDDSAVEVTFGNATLAKNENRIDTIVLDAGIYNVDGYGLKYICALNVLYNDGLKFGSGQFANGWDAQTVAPLCKTKAASAFSELKYVGDFSASTLGSTSWFSEYPHFTEYILPDLKGTEEERSEVLCDGFITGASYEPYVKCLHSAGNDKVADTIDLRGTKYYVNIYEYESGKYTTCKETGSDLAYISLVFKNVFKDGGAKYLIQKEADGKYYKYTWTQNVTVNNGSKNVSNLPSFTREIVE